MFLQNCNGALVEGVGDSDFKVHAESFQGKACNSASLLNGSRTRTCSFYFLAGQSLHPLNMLLIGNENIQDSNLYV